jgi:hypothetical protein
MIKIAGRKQTLIREGWAFCFCQKIALLYTNLLLCTNDADEQTNSSISRRTMYWRIADLSAPGGVPMPHFISIMKPFFLRIQARQAIQVRQVRHSTSDTAGWSDL